jgi:lactoylglutathione lyase
MYDRPIVNLSTQRGAIDTMNSEQAPTGATALLDERPVRIDGLFETHLTVSDLARAVAFYRDTLGLPLAHTVPERRAAFFWIGAPGRAMLGLWEASNVLRMQLHLALATSLEEVLAAPARLRRFGVEPLAFGGAPADEPCVLAWMPAAAVYFRDPDGHSLEFLAMLPDAPRPDLGVPSWSEWRRVTGG